MNYTDYTDQKECFSFSETTQPNMVFNVLTTQPNDSLNNESLSLDQRVNEISIFSLPKDPLLLMCSSFSPQQLGKLSSVSKKFYEIANFPEIWKSFCESVGVNCLEGFTSLSEKNLTWKKLYFNINKDNEFFDPVKSLIVSLINNNDRHFNNTDFPVFIDYYADRLKGINVKRITKKQLGLMYKIQEMSLIFCGKKIKDNDLIKPILVDKGKDCNFTITLKIAPISQEELENADIIIEEDEEVYSKPLELTLTPQEDISEDDDIAIEEEGEEDNPNGFCITM